MLRRERTSFPHRNGQSADCTRAAGGSCVQAELSSSMRNPLSLAFVGASLVCRTFLAHALPSKQCMQQVDRAMKSERMACSDAVCGPLHDASLRIPFSERLSSQCRGLMDRYRPSQDAHAARLLRRHGHRMSKCAADAGSFGSASANNPVVVQTDNVPPFMMCTIPKNGCTNFRKLLRVLMLYPQALPRGATAQMWPAHVATYPTLWQYKHAAAPFTDRYPAFILGRHPCASRARRVRACFKICTVAACTWWCPRHECPL